jgi:hypothetical protein
LKYGGRFATALAPDPGEPLPTCPENLYLFSQMKQTTDFTDDTDGLRGWVTIMRASSSPCNPRHPWSIASGG